MGVFNKIFAGLAAKLGKPDQLMIDATHLKAHRTADSLLKKGLAAMIPQAISLRSQTYRAHQGRLNLQVARRV
jgi:hypothetical protein